MLVYTTCPAMITGIVALHCSLGSLTWFEGQARVVRDRSPMTTGTTTTSRASLSTSANSLKKTDTVWMSGWNVHPRIPDCSREDGVSIHRISFLGSDGSSGKCMLHWEGGGW
ncbi:hypothetical protein HOY80DRAFT_974759 [Tuber brumale]|nr:hypothetical protein HOY80DRAFT_974759 [Tuber brumale]